MITVIRVVLRLLSRVSDSAAARLMFRLISIPRPTPMKPEWKQALSEAARIEFNRNGKRVAWQWGESGPLVICVHGWEGKAAQFGEIGRALARRGLRCVALDLTAHGASAGRLAKFSDFPRDVGALTAHLGESPAACVGHSAGGMLLMASRQSGVVNAERFVVVASPSAPYPPVDVVRELLDPPQKVIAALKRHLGEQFSTDWDNLIAGSLYSRDPSDRLLLIYDEDDQVVDPRQGDVINELWPGSELVNTRKLGHNRVLWDDAVVKRIADFVAEASS